MNLKGRRGVILSAVPLDAAMKSYLREDDFVVACDAGYHNAERLGVIPDLYIGDFDSAPRPETDRETIVLPHVKDDTDTQFAANWLLEHGCKEILLLGVLGGKRLEHTVANLQTGLYLAKRGVKVTMANEDSELWYLLPQTPLVLNRRDWFYLSLFALEGNLDGVSMRGTFYHPDHADLTTDYPLGVSNEFAEETAELCCQSGYGLVVLSREGG